MARVLVAAALALVAVACGGERASQPPPRDPLLLRYDAEMAQAADLRASPRFGWPGAPATHTTGSLATVEATMTGQPQPFAYPRAKRKPIPLTQPIPEYTPSTPPYRVHYGK